MDPQTEVLSPGSPIVNQARGASSDVRVAAGNCPAVVVVTKPTSSRVRLLWAGFLVFLILISRLTLMTRGLYRDESWVANSILSPTLRGMFFYESWVQSTPPLFLLLVRGVAKLFGTSELALRFVPWLGGAISVLFFGQTMRKLFPLTLAMIATAVFATNYWALKYSQQVKQYGTDLLVSSLLLFLLTTFLIGEANRRTFWTLVFAGGAGIFLSYTTVFWFPASALVVLATIAFGENGRPRSLSARLKDCFILTAVYVLCFGLTDWVFIRPNQSEGLTQFWMQDFIGSAGVAHSLRAFFRNLCDLTLPQMFEPLRFISYAGGLLLVVGLIRAVRARLGNDIRGRTVLLVTALPVATALLVSALHKYPLLGKPRLIIWILPITTLLLGYALEPAWDWFKEKTDGRTFRVVVATTLVLISIGAFRLGQFAMRDDRSTPRDDFRSGMLYVKNHLKQDDHLFVYALGAEELKYYSRRLGWQPATVYVANTGLGCCVPGQPAIFGDEFRKSGLQQDVHTFVQQAHGARVWFLLQNGLHQSLIVESAQAESTAESCKPSAKADFSSTLVLGLDCTSSSTYER